MSRNTFIERSIKGAVSFFGMGIFSDEIACQPGMLQRVDARIKAATFPAFILATVFSRDVRVLIMLYALCLAFALLSRIKLGFFLGRTIVFIPLFSFAIALPSLFSFVSPGEALIIIKIWGAQFIITRQGVLSAGIFVMRVLTCLSFSVLWGLTTRHTALLQSLRSIGVPSIFVMVMGMCYRYIFIFAQIILNTYSAIQSRVGFIARQDKGRAVVAWSIAGLWHRSLAMSQDVHDAMLSRGWRGEPVALDDGRARLTDWCWVIFAALVCAAVIWHEFMRV